MGRRSIIAACLVLNAFGASAGEDSSHRAAASRLLVVSGIEQTMSQMSEAMSAVVLGANPTLHPYRDVLEEWMATTMSWKNLEERFVTAYAEAYSESELLELITFFESPTGRKSVELQPMLMKRGEEIGAEVAAEHQQELVEMIAKRKNELEASKAADQE